MVLVTYDVIQKILKQSYFSEIPVLYTPELLSTQVQNAHSPIESYGCVKRTQRLHPAPRVVIRVNAQASKLKLRLGQFRHRRQRAPLQEKNLIPLRRKRERRSRWCVHYLPDFFWRELISRQRSYKTRKIEIDKLKRRVSFGFLQLRIIKQRPHQIRHDRKKDTSPRYQPLEIIPATTSR